MEGSTKNMTTNINSLVLAYLGDSIFEILIREYLVHQNICKVDELQKKAIEYVSAKAQSQFLSELEQKQILTEEELEIVKRARNHKGSRHPKNTDIVTYKRSTGLEALFGYHYLNQNFGRIKELMKIRLGEDYVYLWEKCSTRNDSNKKED